MWNSLYAFNATPFIYAVMLQSQNARRRQKTTFFCCRPICLFSSQSRLHRFVPLVW